MPDIKKEEKDDTHKETGIENTWKLFYKDKSSKERYYLLKEELERVIKEINARRSAELERIEKERQRIQFVMKKMEEEGVWYGKNNEDEERAIAERNAYHRAEKEAEYKRAGITAEMEAIIKAEKLKKKPDGTLH